MSANHVPDSSVVNREHSSHSNPGPAGKPASVVQDRGVGVVPISMPEACRMTIRATTERLPRDGQTDGERSRGSLS